MFTENKFKRVEGYPALSLNENSEIDYSDGEIEKFILKTLTENNGYADWENYIKDWATEYHFSWVRTNILAPVKFNRDHRVLELGGGTGILTHYIAPQVDSITSIEGSLTRGKCISQRCRAFSNVDIIVSNFEDVDFLERYGKHSFDVITLIGVLEYTNKYFKTANAITKLLDLCHELLKPGGSLIIAIENKLGLKYLLGWEEDHVSKPFYGVEERYKNKDVVTFGRHEMSEILKRSNFVQQQFLFPFPDYKLPAVILSPVTTDETEEQKQLFVNLVHKMNFRNYTGNPAPGVMASRALKSVIKNQLIPDVSNSFLIIASGATGSAPLVPADTIAYSFSAARKYAYANTIKFVRGEPNTISFQKRLLGNAGNTNSSGGQLLKLNEYNSSQSLIETGFLLDHLIDDAFIKEDHNRFNEYIRQWIDYLKTEMPAHKYSEFDLMPFNIIVNDKNEFSTIDVKEWECKFSLSIEQVVVRYFMISGHYISLFQNGRIVNRLVGFNNILDRFKLSPLNEEEIKVIDTIHSYSSLNVHLPRYKGSLNNGSNGLLSKTKILSLLKSKIKTATGWNNN